MGVDSPWSLIGSYRKYFKCSREEVLWGMSWINFLMDLATIPSSESDSKKEDEDQVVSPEDEEKELRELLSK
ncbi:hypothetical protein [Pedobacter metabolipauper]|uniref:hypothetical protein n=1 Tax=Pedobacter metabolipauper TaxID=425513 RepID=UPI00105D57DE|nr:hypothetical protein [Pedobacter metabolipauper]